MKWVKRTACLLLALIALTGLALWGGWQAFETGRDGRVVAFLSDEAATMSLVIDGSTRARVFRTTDGRRELVGVIRGHDLPILTGEFRVSDRGPVAITRDAGGTIQETRLRRLQAIPSIERETLRVMEPAWRQAGRPLAATLRRQAATVSTPVIRRVAPATAARWAAERGAPIKARVFRDCADCPEMVVIPAGRFLMGSPPDEAGRDDDEGPQQAIEIETPLAVARFEVTVAEFRRFIEATGYDASGQCYSESEPGASDWEFRDGVDWRAPGFPDYADDHPVVCVNWDDAKAYVTWLGAETGEGYRLLSEAEWEYAARAGSAATYSFGDNPEDLCVYGNGADAVASAVYANSNALECSDGFVYTAPIGTFAPNAFGLHDLHGNAWEWVEDCYREELQSQPDDGSADRRGDCSLRVLRGGSWYDDPQLLRSADRDWDDPAVRGSVIGFRVARTLSPPTP